jgi:hypothetical protein
MSEPYKTEGQPFPDCVIQFAIIKNYTVQIECKNYLDNEFTYPKPSYSYTIKDKDVITWNFNEDNQISNIEAVFYDKNLRENKINKAFFSGVFISTGLSILVSLLIKFSDIIKKL